MAELIHRCFEQLIFEVNALPILREYKDEMIGHLEFLRIQSLADYDRRKSVDELREVWKNVDRAMAQHGLYDRYKPSKKIWDTISMFVSVGIFKPVAAKPAPVKKPESPFKDLDVVRLLAAINKECSGIPFIKMRMPVKTTLTFLEEEAKKPRYLRDQDQIVIAWKRIHPELKSRGILKPFDDEPMKGRLIEFLKG